jgi:hypothetical protein
MIDAIADQALGGSADVAEQAREASYAAQARAQEGVSRTHSLGARLAQHKRDTHGWLAAHAAELDAALRADAAKLADRLAEVRRAEAEVLAEADQLRGVWQRISTGRARTWGTSGEEVALDPDTLVPIERGDVVSTRSPVAVESAGRFDDPDDLGEVVPYIPEEARVV